MPRSHMCLLSAALVASSSCISEGLDLASLPCDGFACDVDRWVVFGLAAPGFSAEEPNRPEVVIDTPCGSLSYRLRLEVDAGRLPFDEGPPLLGALAWSVRPAGGLELAIAELDGDLSLFRVGRQEATASVDLGAVGVAWSNAGDRLAVVTRDRSQPAAQAHQLVILSPQLDELDRFALDLPLSDRSRDLIHDRFVVSWNADDTLVAVSTTIACSTGVATDLCDRWRVVPRCNVVRLADGDTRTLTLYDAWFVGTDTLVAVPASDDPHIALNMARRVERVTLGPAGLTTRQPLIGPVFLYGAHAPAGVFVAQDPPVFTINSVARSVSLRSADGRRRDSRIGSFVLAVSALNATNLPPALIPADVGLRALQDAGLRMECR